MIFEFNSITLIELMLIKSQKNLKNSEKNPGKIIEY